MKPNDSPTIDLEVKLKRCKHCMERNGGCDKCDGGYVGAIVPTSEELEMIKGLLGPLMKTKLTSLPDIEFKSDDIYRNLTGWQSEPTVSIVEK